MADKVQKQIVTTEALYDSLLIQIGDTLESGRKTAAVRVNETIVETYWQIGKYIVEFEQAGNEKAEYGSETLKKLSKDLSIRYGDGFSLSNITKMRKLYQVFPILQTLSAKLSWSHYVELLKIDDPLERSFYLKECEQENWGVRELRRQMKSMLFQRLVLSKDKAEVLRLSEDGQIIEKAEDVIKDPYIFEFTGLPQLPVYKEGDLEDALINNLSTFLLELGKGFTYVGRQQRINIGGRIYKNRSCVLPPYSEMLCPDRLEAWRSTTRRYWADESVFELLPGRDEYRRGYRTNRNRARCL